MCVVSTIAMLCTNTLYRFKIEVVKAICINSLTNTKKAIKINKQYSTKKSSVAKDARLLI